MVNSIKSRLNWIDSLRGIVMVLVASGRILEGEIRAPIYLIHMPISFLISGYLFRRRGISGQLKRQVTELLLPATSCLITVMTFFG